MNRKLTLVPPLLVVASIAAMTLAAADPRQPDPARPAAAQPATPRAGAAAMPLVVSPAWLAAHLHDPDLVVLHVGESDAYAAKHIAGRARRRFVRHLALDATAQRSPPRAAARRGPAPSPRGARHLERLARRRLLRRGLDVAGDARRVHARCGGPGCARGAARRRHARLGTRRTRGQRRRAAASQAGQARAAGDAADRRRRDHGAVEPGQAGLRGGRRPRQGVLRRHTDRQHATDRRTGPATSPARSASRTTACSTTSCSCARPTI